MQHIEKLLSYKLLTHKGSPFELEEAVIKGIPCKIFPRGPQTLQDVFRKAALFADREFIIKDDIRLTFGQAFRQGKWFALFLQEKYNIKKGCRVALMAETGPEWVVAFMALCFAGVVPVIIPVDTKGRAAFRMLEVTNCELMVADLPSVKKLNISNTKYPVVIPVIRHSDAVLSGDHGIPPDSLIFNLADEQAGKNDEPIKDTCGTTPDDEAFLSFTSGTTGKPKGVSLTHRNITTGLMNMMLGGFRVGLRAAKNRRKQPFNIQPCSLLLSPFSHIGGYSHLMLMCYLGGKIVLAPEWNTRLAISLIKSESIRSLCGLSPAMVRDLMHTPRSINSLRSLTHLNIYGVALSRKFVRDLVDKFPHISLGTGYGMTETCGAISTASGMELLDNPEISGLVLPSVDIKIADRNGREALQGDYGEIWVRGAMVMQGYCSEQNDSGVMLEDGWLKTGDLGYVDPRGNLHVAGRLDVLLCGKKQVSLSKLERLVCELRTVDEAAIMEIPNSTRRGISIVVAAIPNNTIPVDKTELAREVFACVKAYTDDIKVVIMNDIPRTASGKVDRRALKQQIKLL